MTAPCLFFFRGQRSLTESLTGGRGDLSGGLTGGFGRATAYQCVDMTGEEKQML